MIWPELWHDAKVIAMFLVVNALVGAWWRSSHCWLRGRRHQWQHDFRFRPQNLTTWSRCERCGWLTHPRISMPGTETK